jgi:sugar lactone lactonase YvrE
MSTDVYRRADASLGEGPCWDRRRQALVWVDIMRREVHLSTPGEDRVQRTPDYVGAAVLASGGGLLLAMDGFATLDLDSGVIHQVAAIPRDASVRMNDGKCDPAGRFWAGTMHVDEVHGAGALYRLDRPAAATRMIAPVTISNGLGWSPDGTWMYYIDTPTRSVRRYEFDVATGTLGLSTDLVDTSAHAGFPDGMTVDAEGNLWVAFWDGGAVRCFSPEGALLEELPVPARRPTSCTFGGPELRQLLITTARRGLSDAELREQPLAGSVLVAEPGVAGLPPTLVTWGECCRTTRTQRSSGRSPIQ